jgi:ribosomal protein L37AE/L43A
MAEGVIGTQSKAKGREADCGPKKNRDRRSFSPDSGGLVEVLREGQECPFCHFAKLKREGDEITCPVCGYGRRACT